MALWLVTGAVASMCGVVATIAGGLGSESVKGMSPGAPHDTTRKQVVTAWLTGASPTRITWAAPLVWSGMKIV